MIGLLLAFAIQDPLPFESAEYGVKLTIPKGWNLDASREPRVILKLNLADPGAVKPELIVYEIRPPEPVAISQHKELVRQQIQRTYRDPKIVDDRTLTVGGKPAFLFAVESKAATDADVRSYRAVVVLSAHRLLGVDGVFPRASADSLAKTYDAFLNGVTFIDRKKGAGLDEGLKNLADAVKRIAATPLAAERKETLDVDVGPKTIGSYTISMRPATRGLVLGTDIESKFIVDLGDDGRVETTVKGFLADDLSVQSVDFEEKKVNREKRTQVFSSTALLSEGEIRSERRINGERTSLALKVPAHAVLAELLEPLQFRLIDQGKYVMAVPVVSAFETEVFYAKLEGLGPVQVKVDDKTTVEASVSTILREDGGQVNYSYTKEKRVLRVGYAGQPFTMKPKP